MTASLEDATSTSRDSRNPEYSPEHGPDHASERHHSRRDARGRALRPYFFGLAALWGFAAGALVIALAPAGTKEIALVPGALGAVVGGWLSSKAYSEVRRRL